MLRFKCSDYGLDFSLLDIASAQEVPFGISPTHSGLVGQIHAMLLDCIHKIFVCTAHNVYSR